MEEEVRVYEMKREYSVGIRKIPGDILVENIFMVLPACSVMAVRGVCKPWRSLTTDPSFVRAHTRCHCDDPTSGRKSVMKMMMQHPVSLVGKLGRVDNNNQIYIRDVEMLEPPDFGIARHQVHMMASCDGLLCFQAYHSKFHHICNPVTKTWSTVPVSPPNRTDLCISLTGFYFHRATNEYKLLQYFSRGDERYTTLGYEVATVNGLWRTVYELVLINGKCEPTEIDKAIHATDFHAGAVTANQNLHWLSLASSLNEIIVFDTNTEKFKEMALPLECMQDEPIVRNFRMSLIEIGGNLCIGKAARDVEEMDIWLMEDYKLQQWTKLHTVVIDSGFTGAPFVIFKEDLEEKITMLMRWCREDKILSICEFKRNIFFHLHLSDILGYRDVYSYTESLVKL